MKENKNSNIMTKLMIIWIITIFFDSYYIICIKDFPVTIFFVFSMVINLFSIFLIIKNKKIKFELSHKISICMIIYLFLNYLVTGMKNINSLCLGEFFFITYIITNRTELNDVSDKYIKVFSVCMNIMAIYGIYQFLGRIYNFPLSDIIIDGHMVKGYNWTNAINIGGKTFLRSNAIFREPSFFSQYLAINIILLFSKILTTNKKRAYTVIMLILNSIAFILSFSGTGFIILGIGIILYVFRLNKDKKIKRRIIIFTFVAIICLAIILNSNIGNYFIRRSTEIFNYTEDNYSGYVRFRSGADVLKDAWKENFLFGIGIGTSDEYINNMENNYLGMTLNGFYRPAVELGLIGTIIWITYIFSLFSKKSNNKNLLIIQCVIIPFIVCHEVFLSNYYWILIYMINRINLKSENILSIDGEKDEKK